MTPLRSIKLRAALAAGMATILASPAFAQSGDTHVINMRDADINAFIEDISAVTGYTFIVHPDVNGRVTVTSQDSLTREEVFEVFRSTLRVQGYIAEPTSNGSYRIVPESTATPQSETFGAEGRPSDQFVTDVIRLNYADAAEAARVVEPLVNHRGRVAAYSDNNTLVVVDYAGNIGRIREIVGELDRDNSEVATIALTNASAREVADVISSLSGPGRDGRATVQLTAVALESSNSVVLRGDEGEIARARALVHDLDMGSAPTETLRVMRLEHARAAELAPLLEAVARQSGAPTEGELTIPFDEATNSIILTASDPRTLEAMVSVVRELDVRPSQVRVEAIIVEISDGVARDLGVQFLLAGDDDSSIPFAATNFSRSAPNLLALTGALTVQDGDDETTGANLADAAIASLLGINGATFGIGGENDDGLFGVILTAVQNDTDSNILSTPSVFVTENRPARINVGQEVPLTTGEALSSDFSSTFRGIERRDVGVQLEVFATISDGDTIMLDVRQEVSSVAGTVSDDFQELILNNREIETTVIADNGEVIVLGGLIDTIDMVDNSQIPLLGDIPLAGRLFRSEGVTRQRRNLMVFLRPTVVEDLDGSRAVTADSLTDVLTPAASAESSFEDRVRDMLGDVSSPR